MTTRALLTLTLLLSTKACISESRPVELCEVDAECAWLEVGPCERPACDAERQRCVPTPAADGRPCGAEDGCLLHTCQEGVCAPFGPRPPECPDGACGPDRCGMDCGGCGPDAYCSEDGQCIPGPEPCGLITFEGCCLPDGRLRYCDEGSLRTLDCGSNPDGARACGWDDAFGYDCVADARPDPEGAFPYLCGGQLCPDSPCESRECGFACGQACGPGCGPTETCSREGRCVPDPCGDIDFFGCCASEHEVIYCDEEVRRRVEVDCRREVGPDGVCGWLGAEEGYWCTTAQRADPEGAYPWLCADGACATTCEERECGSACGQTCVDRCDPDEVCDELAGACVPNPCGDLTFEGCCDGDTVVWCQDGRVLREDCESEYAGDPALMRCGWLDNPLTSQPAGYYCQSERDAEPSGAFPRECQAETAR